MIKNIWWIAPLINTTILLSVSIGVATVFFAARKDNPPAPISPAPIPDEAGGLSFDLPVLDGKIF
jgi:hypothetical protein